MIVSIQRDWGGWRISGSKYDLDPYLTERQAQLIGRAPVFMALLQKLVALADQEPENLSHGLMDLAQLTHKGLSQLED